VTIVEPGGFATDWGAHRPSRAAASRSTTARAQRSPRSFQQAWPGDPDATAARDFEGGRRRDPPLAIFFGPAACPMTLAEYAERNRDWEKWNAVSIEAQGDLGRNERVHGT